MPLTAVLSRQPKGSVLLFTLVIMLLLALMGFSLMANTRTELGVSHNTYLGRSAFQQADLTARLALFAGRVLLHSTKAELDSLLNKGRPNGGYTVKLDGLSSAKDIPPIEGIPTSGDIQDRYLRATAAPDEDYKPHIVVSYGGQVVGTAALTLYTGEAQAPGASLGETGYGSQGENSVRVYLVVSANGRPRSAGEDPTDYFCLDPTGNSCASTQSIVTVVFREIMAN